MHLALYRTALRSILPLQLTLQRDSGMLTAKRDSEIIFYGWEKNKRKRRLPLANEWQTT
jgi:hypothetical protein